MDKPLKNGEKLVIIGAGEFAEIAYEYFTYDSPYELVALPLRETILKMTSFMIYQLFLLKRYIKFIQ